MKQVLKGTPNVLVYLDDILMAAETREQLALTWKTVSEKLKTEGMKIKEEKSIKEAREIEWLGYHISAEGRRPSKEKIDYIQGLEAPRNVKQVRQLMGVINYYGRYIPNLATISGPINDLLQKCKRFKWGIRNKKVWTK